MYAMSVLHLPGHSDHDHLFRDFETFIEQSQSPRGYLTKSGAQRASKRLNRIARLVTTFDGHIIMSICRKGDKP